MKLPPKFPTLPHNFKTKKLEKEAFKPHPKDTLSPARLIPSRPHPSVELAEHGVNTRDQNQRCRNDDSLLDGSVSSCEELSCEDAVFGEENKSQWAGLAGRVTQVEEKVTALEVREGGRGLKGAGAGWSDAMEKMQMRIKVSGVGV